MRVAPYLAGWLATSVLALVAVGAIAQDENPTTPGAIPDPSTYQGSMELQRQSDQQDQQYRQQQSQPQPYYQPNYPQPNRGAPTAGYVPRRSAAAPPPSRMGAQAFGKESPGDVTADKLVARGDYAGALRIWRPLAL